MSDDNLSKLIECPNCGKLGVNRLYLYFGRVDQCSQCKTKVRSSNFRSSRIYLGFFILICFLGLFNLMLIPVAVIIAVYGFVKSIKNTDAAEIYTKPTKMR